MPRRGCARRHSKHTHSRSAADRARWWEARKQWGKQLIVVRNHARLLSSTRLSADDRASLVRLSCAHSLALRASLRSAWFAVGDSKLCSSEPAVHPGAAAAAAAAVADRDRWLTPSQRDAVAACSNPADAIMRLAGQKLGPFPGLTGIDI